MINHYESINAVGPPYLIAITLQNHDAKYESLRSSPRPSDITTSTYSEQNSLYHRNTRSNKGTSHKNGIEYYDYTEKTIIPHNVYYYCAIASLTTLSFGYYLGIISAVMIALPYTMKIDHIDVGYIASMNHLGAAIGAYMCGYLVDKFGRRPVLIWNSIPFLIAGIWMSNSTSVMHLIIGRLICGLAVGAASVSVTIYISEMSPTHLRGKLGVFVQVAITMGIILSYFVGYFVVKCIYKDCWQYMLVIGLILPIISIFLTLFFLPETPRWLISYRRDGEAMAVLLNIYGINNDDLAQEEYFRQFTQFEKDRNLKRRWRDLFDPKYSLHILISVILNVIQQLVGFNIITYYSATLFHHMGYVDADALVWSIATALPQLAFVLLAIHLLELVGRRKLLLISSIGVCITLILLGISTISFMSEHQLTLAMIFIVVFRCFFSIGLGPIPSILASELLPYQIRARGLSLSCTMNWLTNYIITNNFLSWVDSFGITYIYFAYSLCAMIAALFTWLVVWETKGKSLEEIEQEIDLYRIECP